MRGLVRYAGFDATEIDIYEKDRIKHLNFGQRCGMNVALAFRLRAARMTYNQIGRQLALIENRSKPYQAASVYNAIRKSKGRNDDN